MHRWSRDESGFTIVETAFAAMIMLVVLTGVMTGVIFAAQAGPRGALSDAATNLASQSIEQARNLPYDSVGVTNVDGTMGSPPGVIPAVVTTGALTVNTSVSWVYDAYTNRAAYKQVTVIVSWTQFGGGQVRASTFIYGHTSISNAGDVGITVYDADTMVGVPGCSIAVTPNGQAAQYGNTDPNGAILFGYIAVGNAVIAVTPPSSYIVDPSAPTSATIVSAQYVHKTVYLEHASTQTIHVTDSGTGLPLIGATVTCTGYGNPGSLATDSSGNAVFSNVFHAPSQVSTFAVGVTMPGYFSAATSFTVTTGGSTQTTNVGLSRSTALVVTTTDASKSGSPGLTSVSVAVKLGGIAISGSPQVSNSSGISMFSVLSAGTYAITATKPNYTTATANPVVSVGVTSTVTMPMTLWANWTINVTTQKKAGTNNPSIRVDLTGTDIDGNAISRNLTTSSGSPATGSFTLLPAGTYSLITHTNPGSAVPATVSYLTPTVSVTVKTSN